MSEIIDDILDEVELKPKTTKKILKWVIRAAIVLIVGAFSVGGSFVLLRNKINNAISVGDKLEAHKKIDSANYIRFNEELDEKTRADRSLNTRIDKLYEKLIDW